VPLAGAGKLWSEQERLGSHHRGGGGSLDRGLVGIGVIIKKRDLPSHRLTKTQKLRMPSHRLEVSAQANRTGMRCP
jgi:hypothetical protein